MVDTFELIEIDTADTIEELCELEILYIQEYNSYYLNKTGYNMTFGGEGFNGYVRTEEDKQKMSERAKKYHEDNPDARERMSERMKQYYENTPAAREECRERMIKYFEDNPDAGQLHSRKLIQFYNDHPHARQQASERTKAQFQSQEARQQASDIKKELYKQNPEQRKLISEGLEAYYLTPGAREKHGELQKKRFEDPRERQKLFDAQETYWKNPEARQAQSERMKERFKTNPESLKKKLDTQGNNKPFDVSKTDGTFIKTFTYQFEALEYLRTEHNITSTIKIGEVLRGQRESSAGFVFTYK
jgi:hypothetical protein